MKIPPLLEIFISIAIVFLIYSWVTIEPFNAQIELQKMQLANPNIRVTHCGNFYFWQDMVEGTCGSFNDGVDPSAKLNSTVFRQTPSSP